MNWRGWGPSKIMDQAPNIQSQARRFGLGLYFFAAFTLMIKYVFPVTWAFYKGAPLTAFIYFWDAWWIAHLYVGRGFLKRQKGVWRWALLLTVAEILIIAVKLLAFTRAPVLDFWRLSWFVNKSLMLVFFLWLFSWLLKKKVREAL